MKAFLAVTVICLTALTLFAETEAEKTFNDLYGENYKAALNSTDTKDNLTLGQSMLNTISKVEGEKELKAYTYLKLITLTASVPKGLDIALEAAEKLRKLGSDYRDQADDAMLDIYRQQYKTAKGPKKNKAADALAEKLVERADALLKDGEPTQAMIIYRELRTVARYSYSVSPHKVSSLIKAAQSQIDANKSLERLKESIVKNPADTEAAIKLTMMLMIDQDNPKSASKYAPFTKDSDLESVVKLAAKPASKLKAEENKTHADWYWAQYKEASDHAKTKVANRALQHYKTFNEKYGKSDVTKLKVTTIIEDIEKALAEKPDDKKHVPRKAKRKHPEGTVEWNDHHYYWVSEFHTWASAAAASKKLGGQLVCVETKEEAAFLFKQFGNMGNRAWTGGHNMKGKHEWINGKPIDRSIGTYHYWNSGPKTCLSIQPAWSTFDDKGPLLRLHFIIEWED